MKHISSAIVVLLCLVVVSGKSMAGQSLPTRESPLVIDTVGRQVFIFAEVNGTGVKEQNPHWGVVYRGGKFAGKGILHSFVDPLAFHDALVKIGARPGNNLTAESAGQYVQGDILEITATWPGAKREFLFGEIFEDKAGKGFRIRFGGNRHAAEKEHTGCITCLEGCWIAITSNDRYPFISAIKRFISPNSSFKGKGKVLPADGQPVVLSYRLVR